MYPGAELQPYPHRFLESFIILWLAYRDRDVSTGYKMKPPKPVEMITVGNIIDIQDSKLLLAFYILAHGLVLCLGTHMFACMLGAYLL